MLGMAIQKGEKVHLIGACPKEGYEKSAEQLLKNCDKFIAREGFEIVDLPQKSFTQMEEYQSFFEEQGYSCEPYVEMDKWLKDYVMPQLPVPEGVIFDYYKGSLAELREAVFKVEEDWVQYFNEGDCFYCGFQDGKIVSLCILGFDDDWVISDSSIRVGSVGCVGTVPEYRERGIGLAMVAHATQILKEAGCDKSFIHYTALDKWYGRLGYETCMAFMLGEK